MKNKRRRIVDLHPDIYAAESSEESYVYGLNEKSEAEKLASELSTERCEGRVYIVSFEDEDYLLPFDKVGQKHNVQYIVHNQTE